MINQNLLLEIITEDLPYHNSKKFIFNFVKNFILQISKAKYFYSKVDWKFNFRRIIIKIYNLHKLLNNNFKNNIKHTFNKDHLYDQYLNYNNIILKKNKNLLKNDLKNCLNEILLNTINKCNIYKKGIILDDKLNKKIIFIRPIKNILVILNNKLIKINFLKLKTNQYTFLNILNKNIKINNFNTYEYQLYLLGKIIINNNIKKNILINKLKELEIKNNIFIDYSSMIEEFMFFKESPFIIQSSFNTKFLYLPKELLIYIIKKKQKCFIVYSKDKKNILPIFFTIINLPLNNFNEVKISTNFRQIINNFLNEIYFFFLKDRLKKLTFYLDNLKKIYLEEKLGNLFDKTIRIKYILIYISKKKKINKIIAKNIALLSKCDLATLLVQEYPDLRGLIGMCYAKLDKEPPKIYNALKTQYLQNKKKIIFNKKNIFSNLLNIVDYIDDIVGLISIHYKNKKINLNKDPYEIRRKTISLIQNILYSHLNIDIIELITHTKIAYKNINNFCNIESIKINNFIYFKYISWAKKYFNNNLIIQSVQTNFNIQNNNLYLLHNRIILLHVFFKTPYITKILVIYKRINNLLNKVNIYDLKKNDINNQLIINPFEKKILKILKVTNFNCNYINNIIFPIYKLSIYMENFLNNIKIFVKNVDICKNRILISIKVKNLILKLADMNLLINKKI